MLADFTIDAHGRLWLDGIHVGWLRRECGAHNLRNAADKLGAELPSDLDAFYNLTEEKPNV